MLRARECAKMLPISSNKCVKQIKPLKNQHHGLELTLVELRQSYTGMFKDILIATVPVAKSV